jgi:RNA polymerase sigma-70 factor (sigma-E family)
MTRWSAPPAFDEFVRTRHAELLRFAHVLCGDPHLAGDLVQDALERTGLAWRRILRQDQPERYVRRAVVNGYLNRRRALRRERLVDAVPDRPERYPRDPGDHDDTLWRLLAGLPRQQRAVLVLRYYLDYSEAQIAEALGCTPGTVKSTASRAMGKLREALTPAEPNQRGTR